LRGDELRVGSRIVPPVSVSTDGSRIGGVNSCVEGKGALVVVSFGATAPPSTEVEGRSVLEICVGDPLVARECGEAVLPPGDFGRSKPKNVRNRSCFLGFS